MREHWTEQEFKNPPAQFRGAPFWAWNNKLDSGQLVRQIGYFKEMGMGGFHIHCRVGLDTEYLGKEFMECAAACAEEGRKQGLYTYLYDEDRWPSGAAGGLVTKEETYRSRYLVFAPDGAPQPKGGKLLAHYKIRLKNGCLENYQSRLAGERRDDAWDNCGQGEEIWILYLETAKPTPWHNNQTYVDTLNPKAIQRFIDITHETYAKALGDEFGKTIPSIFTDEPQFSRKDTLDFAEEKRTLTLPYTDAFEEFYQQRYGESFLLHLPEVVWELPQGRISPVRYQYHDGIAELFARSFADTLGQWCGEHNLMLTGHMMEEPTLLSQTSALGEAMRSYRSFQQPGIDMLCDWREYTTAKQAQSAAHQFGCPGVLSELYGVTNWDFDFRGHKLQGDWQAALGVTRRVHHLSWVSMKGEAKRDYPASIFYQSPWYKEYKMVEDHFARVNTALMRGKPHVKVGVVHPIESYWLHFGPKEQTAQVRETLEQNFEDVTEWLLFGNIDFDYLAESLLPDLNVHCTDGKLFVGEMAYEAVLVPGCETLRSSTVAYLKEFADQGGTVIFAGGVPEYVDAQPDPAAGLLAEQCVKIPLDKIAVLRSLEFSREIEIRRPDGRTADHFLYQSREEDGNRWIFIANGKKPKTQDIPERIPYQIRLKGKWQIDICDTCTGEVRPGAAKIKDGWTMCTQMMDLHDSLLLHLTPVSSASVKEKNQKDKVILSERTGECNLPQPESFTLDEPNVLLLDQCEYRFDDEIWQETEEILRIDNRLRERLGYPKRMEAWPQPWVQKEDTDESHKIELRFHIHSEKVCDSVYLAAEPVEGAEIIWNGRSLGELRGKDRGWFVDESIRKFSLGRVEQGENILIIRHAYGRKTNLEWCYLLGEFGVRTAGRTAYLTEFPRCLSFGDYGVQGLPFYAGNVIYRSSFTAEEGNYGIQISKYRAALLKVSVDGQEWKPIIYAPYEADLGYLTAGEHVVEILSFGNRVNAFGTVHNCDETTEWFGPNEWRTQDERYAYEYQLKRMGVLKTPVIYRK